MATKRTASLAANTAAILNAIRNSATNNYRDYVPTASEDASSVKEIGAVIMQYPALQNEFLNALINRIGLVMLNSKMYTNPISMFKKGQLEYGESIEEIFVNLADPFRYDPVVAETELFKREIPDVRSAFHFLNYQQFYKTTVQEKQLAQAFLSAEGVRDLVTKIIESMYASAAYDEFITMKYLLAKHILAGHLSPVEIPAVEDDNMEKIIALVKEQSNKYEFMSTEYNLSGVHTYTPKNDQYLIINSSFDAKNDVMVLASAFNMDKAEFTGHRVLIDSFGALDLKRLDQLFAGDENYQPLTEAEIAALDAIPAVLVDKDWFVVVDNLTEFRDQDNAQGLYWNYFLHTWKTFSISPFANASVFVPGSPSITSVTVTPSAVTSAAGQRVQLNVAVVTENFAPMTVTWTTDSDKATVDVAGLVTLADDASGTITVTATSVFDPEKSSTCKITVA
jgi:uncharacterized protein YjdB